MPSDLDAGLYPAFCDACFCEKCMRGFYRAAVDGVKTENGGFKCVMPGCPGTLKHLPFLSWKRLKPCADRCARLPRSQ